VGLIVAPGEELPVTADTPPDDDNEDAAPDTEPGPARQAPGPALEARAPATSPASSEPAEAGPERAGAVLIPLRRRADDSPAPPARTSFDRAALPDFAGALGFGGAGNPGERLHAAARLAGPVAHFRETATDEAPLDEDVSWDPEDEDETSDPADGRPEARFAPAPPDDDRPGERERDGQPLFLRHPYMRTRVDMSEARKARAHLAREWAESGLCPEDEDFVLRGVARALREQPDLAGIAGQLGLADVASWPPRVVALPQPRSSGFRAAVAARQHMLAAEEGGAGDCPCVVMSLAGFRIDEGAPGLLPGCVLTVTAGAVSSHEPGAATLTVTLAYDPAAVETVSAARLLARLRDLLEAPWALLVD
jgi:hypothetical protein